MRILKITLALSLLGSALLATTPARAGFIEQYTIHVPGVTVAFPTATAPTAATNSIRSYTFRLIFPASRSVTRSAYTLYFGPAMISPTSAASRYVAGQVLEQAKQPLIEMDSMYYGVAHSVGAVHAYRHIVVHGRALVLMSTQEVDASSGMQVCTLAYAGSHLLTGFTLLVRANSSCTGAQHTAAPVLDALLKKVS